MTTQPASLLDPGANPDAVMERTMINQSKQVEFDSSLVVEGKRVVAGDELRLPIAVKHATALERERRKENSSTQSPSISGPSVQFRE